ncbi:hypothetical protein [uncultured Porphyromonas sp.]|uniref:hypothetical protein n=1 Tax=uncultured Porphyromonas sp. TaxID=159274 RepID=UPI0025E0DA58|nr:hypothetical protein [uncultured Porphyromonas sp.]
MNKLMNVLFGAEMHASAKEIRGKKSNGIEDYSSYKHWAVKLPKEKGINPSNDLAGAVLLGPFLLAKKMRDKKKNPLGLDIN